MDGGSLPKVLIVTVMTFGVLLQLGVEAQSEPCTTPTKVQGLCVPIRRCRNIYNIVTNPTPPPTGIANYIKRAACVLPNVERSICCQMGEVIKEEAPVVTVTQHPKANLLPKDCGQTVNDRISKGNVTQVFAYPWMAVLQYDNNGKIIDGCGGSLINKRYILTAAHCIKTRSTLRLANIKLGEHTKNQTEDCNIYRSSSGEEEERDCADPPVDYEIESFVVHPDYNRPRYSNDIGLIRLKKDVITQDHIKPVCLPLTPELRSQQLDKFIVTGWGATENSTGSNVLLEATLPRVDNVECQRRMTENRLNVQLSDKQLCAGGVDQVDTCRGDSGGPLGFSAKYSNQARFVQFGVVSAGVDSCGLKSVPGIYCRVAAYMDWILDNMQP